MFLLMWKMQPDEETIYQNTFLGYEQHIILLFFTQCV